MTHFFITGIYIYKVNIKGPGWVTQRHIISHLNFTPEAFTIDKWIKEAKHNVCPPVGDGHVHHRSLDYLLWQDNVECILNVKQRQVSQSSGL
jgi:hypothetical protein